ncbi:uncharacterized protein LOC115453863 [Manduca sexta]|uniref:uncharacterized protein LOC115453863 n=1 Tax=Manduca sexta TaxID=7130 RepID=UPI0018908D1B|nr:uncharacterized protein LOC115453863 [Manduca sexta]
MLSLHPLSRVLYTTMAARFVVALALVTLCHGYPADEATRDSRAYSIGQAYNSNGGVSQASANTNGGVSQAFGSSTSGAQYARDGLYYPGQAIAKAETYDTPETVYSPSKAIAQAQNGGVYQPIPIPGAVLTTYQQNFEAPILPGGVAAKSSAVSDGVNDQSISSVSTNGAGDAQSSAQTKGVAGYDVTSTNTKASGNGYGSAASNAVNGYNSAVTSAKSNGFGSVVSNAQSNGAPALLTPVVPSEVEPSVIDAKKQPVPTSYIHPYVQSGYGSASSNANVNGYGSASSSAKSSNDKGIHWRFGSFYDGTHTGAVYPP